MTELWRHQADGVDAAWLAIKEGVRRVLVTTPTGGGKTRQMSELARLFLEQGEPVLLYANRKLLIEQLSRVLKEAGLAHGVRAAGHAGDAGELFQVASIQTEHSRAVKRQQQDHYRAKLIIVDEAHCQTGEMFKKLIDRHLTEDDASVVGYTATPIELGDYYDRLIVAGTMSQLRECGATVLATHYGADEPDLKKLKVPQGADLSESQQRSAIMRPGIFGRVWSNFETLNPDRRPTILFAPGVRESLWFAEQFVAKGVTAAHIDGESIWINGEHHEATPETRAQLLADSKSGRVCVLCNRFVLREGIDAGWLSHCILATVIGSLQSYLQAGGRLLRAYPGVEQVTVQDHGGCLDSVTQVLTDSGWKSIDEVNEDTIAGTMNMEKLQFEWSPCLAVVRKPRDDSMHIISTPHLDLRITGYHEMVMRADLRRGRWKKVKASDLRNRQSNWVIPVACFEEVEDASLTDHELGFIGWFLTDGCLDSARIRIYQSANSPLAHHDHIIACLQGCSFRYSIRKRTRPSPFGEGQSTEVIYSVSSGRKSDQGWDHLTSFLNKSFPLYYFDRLSRRQFGVLLHAMNLGDGLKHSGYNQRTISLAVANKETADNIQSLAVRRGYRCNMAKEDAVYVLHIRDSWMATVAKGELREGIDAASEEVWCVQTNTGTVICRRNGKVAIVGNSWWRHGSLNADREWFLDWTQGMHVGVRAERLKKGCCRQCGERLNGPMCIKCHTINDYEPTCCPQCHRIVQGPRCSCGWVAKEGEKRSRPVVSVEGVLKEHLGDVFTPRRITKASNGLQVWERMYWRARTEEWDATFMQAEAMFAQENNYGYPDRSWPLMPREEADLFRKVRDVPFDRLIPREGGFVPPTSKCRSCSKPIIWCVTEAGKRAPIDTTVSLQGNVIICGDQCRVVDRVKEPAFEGIPLHTNHFSTCAQASLWKNQGVSS